MNKIWSRFDRMSLSRKFITALLFCSLGTACFLGLVVSNRASKAIEQDIDEKLNAISTSKLQEFQASFEKVKGDLKTLSTSKFLQDALVAYESVAYGTGLDLSNDADFASSPYFKSIQSKFAETFEDYLKSSNFNSFAIALNNGSVVSQTGGSFLLGKNLDKGSFKSQPVGPCYATAKSHGTHFTDLQIDFDKNGRAYLCTVIKSKYDRDVYKKDAPMGVLVVDLNWDLFNRVSKFTAGLGELGEIVLLGSDSKLRTFPRALAASSKLENLAGGKWTEKVDGASEKMQKITDHSGDTVYAITQAFKLDEKNQWWIVTQESVSEARRPIRDMQIWSALLLVISAVMVSVVGWKLSAVLSERFMHTGASLISANHDVSQVSENVAQVARSVQSGSQQQASAIHETSVALEELTQMVARTAELSSVSKSKSESCEREAGTGLGKIANLLESIDKVDESSKSTLTQIDKANESFQELLSLFNTINSKTQVINDIAFQTKLLSFNASVEAARAGEHGKGFAVVAEEVGKLAISVSSAAGEINSLLSTSSSKMNSMIDENRAGLERASSDSKREIDSSKTIASECNQFFESLSKMVGEINNEMNQISAAATEQKTGIAEINRAVGQISTANDENVSNANVINDLSGRLMTVVNELTTSNRELDKLLKGQNAKADTSLDITATDNLGPSGEDSAAPSEEKSNVRKAS